MGSTDTKQINLEYNYKLQIDYHQKVVPGLSRVSNLGRPSLETLTLSLQVNC